MSLSNKKTKDSKRYLRKVIIKIRLERVNIQKEILVEAFLDSDIMGLIVSLEFAKKYSFKLERIEKLIYGTQIKYLIRD